MSPTNVGSHNPPPFGGQRPRWHSFFSAIDVGPPPKSTPLWSLVSLLAHRLVSTPLRGTASLLAHRPVSGSDTICNGPSPPLTNIVLFGLSLSGFSSRLYNTSARERFPHPYKGCFVLLPNQCGIVSPTIVGSHTSYKIAKDLTNNLH